tara:strand:+ start:7821 stop:9701 length:1881 start_codon:yes stop_codon:yes gene_type:complete
MNNKYPTTKPSLNLDFANTKSLDPRITFRRGTPGTYYDGVTHAKAEENLLSYSEDISNSKWSKNESTVSSNSIAAPDGGTTADKIVESNQAGNHSVYQIANLSSTTSQFVFSVYAKAGERSVLSLNGNRTAFFSVLFDLTNGSFISKFESNCRIDSYSIVDSGNQWFRCSVVVSPTFSDTSPRLNLSVADSNVPSFDSVYRPTYTGDGSSGLYVWGAQLEQRDTVTSYTATNGAPITKYQPKLMTASPDRARFDHDPITGESKGLLIEEQRTNLIAYSEDFKSSFWDKSWDGAGYSNEHIYSNQAIAPDGSLSASKVSPGSDSGVHYVGSDQANILENTTYTISCYLKKGEMDTAMLSMWSYADVNEGVSFDLTNGVSDASWGGAEILDHSITHVGNDWYRCAFTVNSGTGTSSNAGFLYLYIDSAGGTVPSGYSGNGFDGLYIWGFQVEQATFPTSYIKTTGASATRSADNASITGENFSSWYRQDEGSIYSEISSFDDRDSQARITLSDGTDSNRIFMAANIGSNILKVDGWGSSNIGDYDLNINNFEVNKIYKKSFGLKRNDYFISIDGQAESGVTSQDMPLPLVNRFDFSTRSFTHYVNGHIKKLAYYPQRLTNEQLQNLTK